MPTERIRLRRFRTAIIAVSVLAAGLGSAAPVAAQTGIDIEMPVGRSISIDVSAAGVPVANVNITACPPETPNGGQDCAGTQTDGDGHARLAGLPQGTWIVTVAPPEFPDENGFLPDVSGGYYADNSVTGSLADADQVSTQAGNPTIAVALPPGGHLAGIVDAAGSPVPDATVSACLVATFNCYAAITDQSGAYDIGALEAASYYLRIEAPVGTDLQSGYVAAGGIVADEEAADVQSVSGGAVTTANASLPTGRHIAGTISGPDGPLDAATVDACAVPDGYPCTTATTDSSGAYTIVGLNQASYYIRVTDPSGVLPTVFYRIDGPTANYRNGTPVDVTSADATGIDVELPSGATLTGTITLPGGSPAELSGVQACVGSCNDANFFAETDADGRYTFTALPPGNYLLYVYPVGDAVGGYATSAGLVELETDAEAFAVSAGATVTRDAQLAEAGAIVGTIALSNGGAVVGSISACRGELCQYGSVADGVVSINGLRPGTYVVFFEPDFGSGVLQGYHADGGYARTAAGATPIVIGGFEDESIAIVIPADPEPISGVITAEGQGPIAEQRVVACASANDCGVADTQVDGSYAVRGLWPDEYTVKVLGSGEFRTAWYSSSGTVVDESLATPVRLGGGGGGGGGEDNTPVGTDVTVEPVEPGSGTSPVRLTFASVTESGETSLAITANGPGAPDGYAFGEPEVYFQVSTTAAWSGSVEVCVDYGEVPFRGDESLLRLMQLNDSGWTDLTTSADPAIDEICGTMSSFRLFAVATDTYEFAGFFAPVANPPTVNRATAGSYVNLRFSLDADGETNFFAEDSPLSYPVDCTTLVRTGARETPTLRLTFDRKAARYTLRWRTERAWAGQCREFEMRLRDGVIRKAYFDFRH